MEIILVTLQYARGRGEGRGENDDECVHRVRTMLVRMEKSFGKFPFYFPSAERELERECVLFL